jgi:hypothetical protein
MPQLNPYQILDAAKDRCIENTPEAMFDLFGPLISTYTRAQAIEDGALVDVSEPAREAGIKFPVAITRGVWSECVALPEGYHGCQDETGRLWDVISMLRFAIRRSAGGERIDYGVLVRAITKQLRDDQRAPRLHRLKALCGPGDDAEPVITVMLPGED